MKPQQKAVSAGAHVDESSTIIADFQMLLTNIDSFIN